MLRLHRTLALLLWYFLLLHRRALTDEDAQWGPTTSTEKSPEKKSSYSWWRPPIKFSLPFSIPFYGSSEIKDEDAVFTTTLKGLTEPSRHFLEDSGSGDGSIPEGSQPPTTLAQELLTSVTEIRTESLPQGTSDWPHSSTVQSNNDALVSPTSSFITNTLLASSPTSSDTPKQNATHTHLPWGTTEEAQPTMDVTTQNPSTKQSDSEVDDNVSEKSSSTIPTTTTALTWHTTTPDPREVTTTPANKLFLGSVALSTPKGSTISNSLPSVEATESTQSQTELIISKTSMGYHEEHPERTSTIFWIDPQQAIESTVTTTTETRRATFPMTQELPRTEIKEEEEGASPSSSTLADESTASTTQLTVSQPRSTESVRAHSLWTTPLEKPNSPGAAYRKQHAADDIMTRPVDKQRVSYQSSEGQRSERLFHRFS